MATILLAEDEDQLGNLVALKLENAGHTVARATDGKRALELAGSLRPDLILLDVTRPVMDGLKTLGRLEEDPGLAPIPVILMTAEGQVEDIRAGRSAGVADYVVKPFSLKDLVARVQKHLGRAAGDARDD